MADFINTIDVLGDDVVFGSIISKTITEFKDNSITEVGPYAFWGCKNLNDVVLPNVTKIGACSFNGCLLANIELPNLTEMASGTPEVFGNAGTSATKVCFPKLANVPNDGFRLSLFKHIDLPVCTSIGTRSFYCAANLSALILRSVTLCTTSSDFAGSWNGNTPPIGKGEGYIYVPRALVDSYKAATNWSTYAAQFRALEDYTVDGTITGELDETKI